MYIFLVQFDGQRFVVHGIWVVSDLDNELRICMKVVKIKWSMQYTCSSMNKIISTQHKKKIGCLIDMWSIVKIEQCLDLIKSFGFLGMWHDG